MTVTFKNALCCDVDEFEYEKALYHSVMLYSYDDKLLYRVSIPSDISPDDVMDFISEPVICDASMTSFNGKNKFKLLSIQHA